MALPLLDSALSTHNIILDSLRGQCVAQSLMGEFDCVTDVEYDPYDAHAVTTYYSTRRSMKRRDFQSAYESFPAFAAHTMPYVYPIVKIQKAVM